MAGYTAEKRYAQINHAVQDRVGNVIKTAQLVLKHIDGTAADEETLGDIVGSVGGANPSYTDDDGYVAPFYKHGDYIAEWTAHNDTTQRFIRIPPAFEDFGLVDVTKFQGVDPTGATDSKAGIDRALIECAGKFTLFFPPGDYRADNKINQVANTHVVGCGILTRIFAGPANTGALVGHVTTAGAPAMNNVTWENVLFDGNGPERATTGGAVYRAGYQSVGGSYVTLRNCFFTNAKDTDWCLNVQDTTNPRIINCVLLDGGKDGINILGCHDGLVVGNVVLDCHDDGIALWDCDGVNVSGNLISRSPESSDFGRCIVASSDRCNVSGNYCEGGKRGGIELNGATTHSNVTGNLVVNSGNDPTTTIWGNGIHYQVPGNVDDHNVQWISEFNNIVGNVIVNPRQDGIFLESHGTSIEQRIQHSDVSNNIVISDGIGNAAFKSGLGVGIRAQHQPVTTGKIEHVSIHNNRVFGFDREGILVQGIASSRHRGVTVEGNKVYNSGAQAIQDSNAIKISYTTDFKLRNNTGEDTQTFGGQSQLGVAVDNPGGVAIITGNDMVRCKTYSFSLANMEDAANAIIRDNPGFSPWSGRAALAGGAWTLVSGSVYKRTLAVTFGVPISVAQSPRIIAVTDHDGWFVTISGITATGFTANVFSVVGDPGSGATGTIHWQAEV